MGIFSVVPLTEPCALRSTQPPKVSTRDFSWGKGGQYVWLTTYHPCSAKTSRKSRVLTYPEPLGPPRPVAGGLYFYFIVRPNLFLHKYTNSHILVILPAYTAYEDGTECSETLAHKGQTPGNHPKERINK